MATVVGQTSIAVEKSARRAKFVLNRGVVEVAIEATGGQAPVSVEAVFSALTKTFPGVRAVGEPTPEIRHGLCGTPEGRALDTGVRILKRWSSQP